MGVFECVLVIAQLVRERGGRWREMSNGLSGHSGYGYLTTGDSSAAKATPLTTDKIRRKIEAASRVTDRTGWGPPRRAELPNPKPASVGCRGYWEKPRLNSDLDATASPDFPRLPRVSEPVPIRARVFRSVFALKPGMCYNSTTSMSVNRGRRYREA